MAKPNCVLTALLAALVYSGGVSAQAPSKANLHGVVITQSGVAAADVHVTVSAGGNVAGSGLTNAAGNWTVQVDAGQYRIRFEAVGFEAAELDGVQAPGESISTTLSPIATAKVSIEEQRSVTYRPVVDTERTQQADFISAEQIENLPLNARDYLNLAALTPAVALVNNYVGVRDTPLIQAPQSGLSFGGSNGRGNAFWLDGGENNINSGGARPSISQEAVAEFHVDRSNYSAEFGGGLGGIVNIISKSGSNGNHGDIFGFLRATGLNARNYFDLDKPSYTRTQFGGTWSSALTKDRTFVFLSLERLDRHNTGYSLLGRESGVFGPTPGQLQILNALQSVAGPSAAPLVAGVQAALTTSSYPQTLALFASNRGNFPFRETNTVGSVRIDHRVTDNNNGFIRFNASGGQNQNSQVDGQQAIGRASQLAVSDATLLINDTDVISERLVSESRLSFNRFRYGVNTRDQFGPSTDIAGYAYTGPDYTLPSAFNEWHIQLKQNMFYTPGKHSIRFGVDFNPVHDSASEAAASTGYFIFGSYVPFGSFLNSASGMPTLSATLAGLFNASGQAALAQALNAPLTGIQAYSLGLPASYTQSFNLRPFRGWFQRYNFYFNDVYRIHPRLTLNAGVRYELEQAPVLGMDRRPLAPRIALAWDATGDKKTVIRAGYGLFFLQGQVQIAAAEEVENAVSQITLPLSGIPGVNNPRTGQPLTSADIYQTLFAQGVIGRRQIQSSDMAQFGIVPGVDSPLSLRFTTTNNFRRGYSEQASFEIERAIASISVSAAYNFNRGAHLPRLIDSNQGHGPAGPDGQPTLVPVNPLIGQQLLYEAAANSYYHALILQAARRFRSLTFDAHYTFSKSIDEATDINFLPNDSLEPGKERGLSTFDQRHRFVASAVWSVPSSTSNKHFARLFSGFTFSPVMVAASGRPFNVITGTVSYDSVYQRPAGAGRNIGHGPSLSSFDLRVSRAFRLTERTRLEVIAEGFNLFNQTNFLRLNNVVGNLTVNELPKPLVGTRGDFNQPLSFVSALDPRVVQLALKVKW